MAVAQKVSTETQDTGIKMTTPLQNTNQSKDTISGHRRPAASEPLGVPRPFKFVKGDSGSKIERDAPDADPLTYDEDEQGQVFVNKTASTSLLVEKKSTDESLFKLLKTYVSSVDSLNRVNREDVYFSESDIPCDESHPWTLLTNEENGLYRSPGIPPDWYGVYELGIVKVGKDDTHGIVLAQYCGAGKVGGRLKAYGGSNDKRLPGMTLALRSGHSIVYRMWKMSSRRACFMERILLTCFRYKWNVGSTLVGRNVYKISNAPIQRNLGHILWTEERQKLFYEAIVEYGASSWIRIEKVGAIPGSKYAGLTAHSMANRWSDMRKTDAKKRTELLDLHKHNQNRILPTAKIPTSRHDWTKTEDDALVDAVSRLGTSWRIVASDPALIAACGGCNTTERKLNNHWSTLSIRNGARKLLERVKAKNRQRYHDDTTKRPAFKEKVDIITRVFIPVLAHLRTCHDEPTRILAETVPKLFQDGPWHIFIDAKDPIGFFAQPTIPCTAGLYFIGVGKDAQTVVPTFAGSSHNGHEEIMRIGLTGTYSSKGVGVPERTVLFPENDRMPLSCYVQWIPMDMDLAHFLLGTYLFMYDFAWNTKENGITRIVPAGYTLDAKAPTGPRKCRNPNRNKNHRHLQWTADETKRLLLEISRHGKDWKVIAKKMNMTERRCFTRWNLIRDTPKGKRAYGLFTNLILPGIMALEK